MDAERDDDFSRQQRAALEQYGDIIVQGLGLMSQLPTVTTQGTFVLVNKLSPDARRVISCRHYAASRNVLGARAGVRLGGSYPSEVRWPARCAQFFRKLVRCAHVKSPCRL